jgi:hypothetical protein
MLSYDDSPWLLRLCEFVAVYFAGEIDFPKIDHKPGEVMSLLTERKQRARANECVLLTSPRAVDCSVFSRMVLHEGDDRHMTKHS